MFVSICAHHSFKFRVVFHGHTLCVVKSWYCLSYYLTLSSGSRCRLKCILARCESFSKDAKLTVYSKLAPPPPWNKLHWRRCSIHTLRIRLQPSARQSPTTENQPLDSTPTRRPWWNWKWQSSFVLGSITLSPNRIPRQSIKRMNYACRSGHHGIDGACKSPSPLPLEALKLLVPLPTTTFKYNCVYIWISACEVRVGEWFFCMRMVG